MLLNGAPLSESLCKCLKMDNHWFNSQLRYFIHWTLNEMVFMLIVYLTLIFIKASSSSLKNMKHSYNKRISKHTIKCSWKIWHLWWHLYNSGLTYSSLSIEAAFSRRHIVLCPPPHTMSAFQHGFDLCQPHAIPWNFPLLYLPLNVRIFYVYIKF